MSRPARPLDLMREVLDHEVIDADEVSCGMVDDIEFEVTDGGLSVAALLIGPGAWAARVPAWVAWVAEKLFGHGVSRVPWSEVVDVSEVIRLRSKASALGLGALDRKVGGWIARLPKS